MIPTCDRPESLRLCLDALSRQDLSDLDLVVVDDGPEMGTPATTPPDARLVRTSGAGPAAARNAGARAARGEVICFIDDDCEPEPGWARSLAGAAALAGTAAGWTVTAAGSNRFARASQALTNELQQTSLMPDGRLGFAPTCNLAVCRETLDELPFDESFPAAAGEDREWCARAAANGLGPCFEPAAVVRHRPRADAAGFARQQLRYGRAALRFRARDASGTGARLRTGQVARLAVRSGPAVGGLIAGAQLLIVAGMASEALFSPRAS